MEDTIDCNFTVFSFYDIIILGGYMIEHANIFYVRNIHAIGGVETFVYELVKKYKDYDIAVVCKDVAPEQKKRLQKYCRVYIHKQQQIKCNVIITNWDTSIYDYVNESAKKYTVLHTDYKNSTERKGLPKDRPDITYIGITEISKKNFEEITGITRTILCRNPLEIGEDEPMLTLVSATRLSKIKDDGRHLKLAEALEKQGVKFIWYIFTTDEYNNNPIWTNKNIVRMKNRLDLGWFIKNADWYVQLSSCEGDSYSLKEALYRNTPIVVCELPYFKEIGIEDNKNALFYNIDNTNANEIANKMKQPLKFTFKKVEDGYNELLDKTKSHYEEELKMKFKVRALINFTDMEDNKKRIINEEWICSMDRAEYLKDNKAIEIVEEVKEEKKDGFGKEIAKHINIITTEEALKDVIPADLEEKPKKATKKKTSKK